MKNILILLQFICILLLVIFKFTGKNNILPAEKEPPKTIIKDMIKDALGLLKSDNAVESDKGANQILEIKKTIENELLTIITDDKVTFCYDFDIKPPKLNAIKLTGEFRNQKAVEVLYDNIFYGAGRENAECLPSPLPPAIKALIEIGKPSINFLVNQIKNENFGKMSYSLPAKTLFQNTDVSVDEIYIKQYIDKDIDLYVGTFYKIVIDGIYSEPKFLILEILSSAYSEHEKEVIKKNLEKMLLYE